MNQSERRIYLIKELLNENSRYEDIEIPADVQGQKRLLRSLMNVRMAGSISEEFIKIQNEYLSEENKALGIVHLDELNEVEKDIYLWQGDITRLDIDAIVNAANSQMTGCYQPCHACIDNCIHTYAGIQLRNYCNDLMVKQGFEESTGRAKITPAFNLPCRYVIHTVGPIVYGKLNEKHEELLRSCYLSCLEKAEENELESIAFCCISTGVFHFPNKRSAEIAVQTVKEFKNKRNSGIKVVFNVFKDEDLIIYRNLLVKK